jgi:hypothetical protein
MQGELLQQMGSDESWKNGQSEKRNNEWKVPNHYMQKLTRSFPRDMKGLIHLS